MSVNHLVATFINTAYLVRQMHAPYLRKKLNTSIRNKIGSSHPIMIESKKPAIPTMHCNAGGGFWNAPGYRLTEHTAKATQTCAHKLGSNGVKYGSVQMCQCKRGTAGHNCKASYYYGIQGHQTPLYFMASHGKSAQVSVSHNPSHVACFLTVNLYLLVL